LVVTDSASLVSGGYALSGVSASGAITSCVTNLNSYDLNSENTYYIGHLCPSVSVKLNPNEVSAVSLDPVEVVNAIYQKQHLSSVSTSATSASEITINLDSYPIVSDLSPLPGLVDSFFSGCSNSLTKVEFDAPKCITKVGASFGSGVFSGFSNLTEVSVSFASLDSAGDDFLSSMFSGCSSLTKVDVNLSSLATVGASAFSYMFSGCSSLGTNAVDSFIKLDGFGDISSAGSYFANYMFYGCSNISVNDVSESPSASITFPNVSATGFGLSAFTNVGHSSVGVNAASNTTYALQPLDNKVVTTFKYAGGSQSTLNYADT